MSNVDRQKSIELNFEEIINEIRTILEKNTNTTLATSLNDRVTARTVQYISKDLDVYFTSWEFNKKIEQIKGNPNVALNINTLQIEGIAKILGSPYDADNKEIADMFIAKYKWFSREDRPGIVLVKVSPKKIVKFASIDKIFHLQNINLENKKAFQMKLRDKENPNYPY